MTDYDEFAKHLGKVFAFMDKASGEGLHFADNNFPDNDLEASDIIVDLATVLDLELIDCADIPASITEAVIAALSPTPTNPERLVDAVSFDMDAAPKDGKILLWIPEEDRTHLVKAGYWIRGQWDDNRYAKKPKPYWSTDDERIVGTIDRRKNQPTAWMPLPAAPLKEGK